MPDKIRRYGSMKIKRSDTENDVRIVGHSAVTERETIIGGWMPFREKISRGAFTEVIAQNHDVRALINHDKNQLLARVPKTLQLKEDEIGLHATISPNMDASYTPGIIEAIDRGDITGQSFSFRIIKEEWTFDDDDPANDLRDIKLIGMDDGDVGPVTYPAYKDTDVAVAREAWPEQMSKEVVENMSEYDTQIRKLQNAASKEHKAARDAYYKAQERDKEEQEKKSKQELDFLHARVFEASFINE